MGKYDFDTKTRERIKERDKTCIFCQIYGNSGFPATQIMHYKGRAQGGRGIEENGAFGCVVHHQELDNSPAREKMLEAFRAYLRWHYPDWDEKKLVYDKWEFLK